MHGDVISLEEDRHPGEPLLKPVMTGGRRLHPPVPLGELQAHAARELQRLPSSLRRLDPVATYPVDLSHALVRLVRDFDERLGARQTQAT
jgi:nicotinate phosphoribosyltransferase